MAARKRPSWSTFAQRRAVRAYPPLAGCVVLPSVGGGSSLRGYSSWRFRDANSLLLQGEWRISVNRYFDLAFFYDAGKVASRTADLDFDHLRSDWGVGTRFHGPFSTPLRIEIAKSREGLSLIFASSASF